MTKLSKILSMAIVTLMLVSTTSFGVTVDSIMSGGTVDSGAQAAFNTLGGTIVNYITTAAMVIAVVVIAVLGVKYMIGSSEEKAEYKKSMIPLLVGAVLVFGAGTIAKIVTSLF